MRLHGVIRLLPALLLAAAWGPGCRSRPPARVEVVAPPSVEAPYDKLVAGLPAADEGTRIPALQPGEAVVFFANADGSLRRGMAPEPAVLLMVQPTVVSEVAACSTTAVYATQRDHVALALRTDRRALHTTHASESLSSASDGGGLATASGQAELATAYGGGSLHPQVRQGRIATAHQEAGLATRSQSDALRQLAAESTTRPAVAREYLQSSADDGSLAPALELGNMTAAEATTPHFTSILARAEAPPIADTRITQRGDQGRGEMNRREDLRALATRSGELGAPPPETREKQESPQQMEANAPPPATVVASDAPQDAGPLVRLTGADAQGEFGSLADASEVQPLLDRETVDWLAEHSEVYGFLDMDNVTILLEKITLDPAAVEQFWAALQPGAALGPLINTAFSRALRSAAQGAAQHGRPTLAFHWLAEDPVYHGAQATLQCILRNTGDAPLFDALLLVRLPDHCRFLRFAAAPDTRGNYLQKYIAGDRWLVWRLVRPLPPREIFRGGAIIQSEAWRL